MQTLKNFPHHITHNTGCRLQVVAIVGCFTEYSMFILPPNKSAVFSTHIHLVIEKEKKEKKKTSKQLFERSIQNLSQKVTVKARAGIQKSEMQRSQSLKGNCH